MGQVSKLAIRSTRGGLRWKEEWEYKEEKSHCKGGKENLEKNHYTLKNCNCVQGYIWEVHFALPRRVCVSVFSFFFSWKVWLFNQFSATCGSCALFTDPQILLFSNFFIKNGPHSTIYTFKNYFAIMFFSFQFSVVSKRTLSLKKIYENYHPWTLLRRIFFAQKCLFKLSCPIILLWLLYNSLKYSF